MDEKNAQPKYIPGSCNIGEKEIRRRYRIGFIGLFLAVLTVTLIHLLKANYYWRLIIFIPVFYALSGFIQAMSRFCFVFGFRSVFSLEGRRMLTKVQDNDAKKKDKKKAYLIVGDSYDGKYTGYSCLFRHKFRRLTQIRFSHSRKGAKENSALSSLTKAIIELFAAHGHKMNYFPKSVSL